MCSLFTELKAIHAIMQPSGLPYP